MFIISNENRAFSKAGQPRHNHQRTKTHWLKENRQLLPKAKKVLLFIVTHGMKMMREKPLR
jgi:hypothetical protein